MVRTFFETHLKLGFWLVLSSMLILSASTLRAHELQPTVADLSVDDGQAQLVLRINTEAFLANVNLDGLQDTDDAADPQAYDALRALSASEIEARAPQLLQGWNALPVLRVDGVPVALNSVAIDVPDDTPEDLARLAEWRLSADVPAGAKSVTVSWPEGAGALVVRQQGVDAPFTGYLDGGQSSDAIALAGGDAQTSGQAFFSYIPVGFDHILPKGLDHILFVLGLFLLSTQMGPLLWQVSAFTLAHTVTLALGAMGWVNVSGSIVEPLIAASIVYVAVENIFLNTLSRWRPFVIFGFGLLHGLGFASVLGDFGLPDAQFVPALIGFNVGVELGQLSVIVMAAALVWLAVAVARVAKLEGDEDMVQEHHIMFRAISITGSLIIAIIGVYWVIERVFF